MEGRLLNKAAARSAASVDAEGKAQGPAAALGECGAGEPPGAVAEALERSGAWRKAVRKGMEGRLLNLASRGDVSKRGFGPDELLGALLTAGGLVNKAKDALLETAEA